jgi:hypothetical protein
LPDDNLDDSAVVANFLGLGEQTSRHRRQTSTHGGFAQEPDPPAGRSFGDALAAMERISAKTLPAGYGYEWTGTAVFGGMLTASTLGIFLIPMLYVVFQWSREKFHGGALSPGAAKGASGPCSELRRGRGARRTRRQSRGVTVTSAEPWLRPGTQV